MEFPGSLLDPMDYLWPFGSMQTLHKFCAEVTFPIGGPIEYPKQDLISLSAWVHLGVIQPQWVQ